MSYVYFGDAESESTSTAVKSAPQFVQAGKSLVAGNLATAISQGYDAQHAIAEKMPIVEWFIDIEQEILGIADALGIGPEVRQLYKNAGIGAQAGAVYAASPVPSAIAAATAGTAFQGLGMWAAAAGVGVGALVGSVLAVLDIFDDDEDAQNEARKKARREAKAKAIAKMLARLDAPGLAAEQKDLASRARSTATAMGFVLPKGMANARVLQLQKQATYADKLAKLFTEVPKKLDPTELKVFLGATNIARWRMFMDYYLKIRLPKIDAIIARYKKQKAATSFAPQVGPDFFLMPLESQRQEYLELSGKLMNNILQETIKLATDPTLKKSAQSPAIIAAQAKKFPIVKLEPPKKWSPVVAISIGAIVAAAGVAGAIFLARKKRAA